MSNILFQGGRTIFQMMRIPSGYGPEHNMKCITNWWRTSIALRSSTLSGRYKNAM